LKPYNTRKKARFENLIMGFNRAIIPLQNNTNYIVIHWWAK